MTILLVKKQEIQQVFTMLKDRTINPRGSFDKGGRFYLENSDCISVRAPSRVYPYSEMKAGRTKKYILAVAKKFACTDINQLLERV